MRINNPVTQKENDIMGSEEFIISKTDTNGIITYVNTVFCQVSGFSEKELLGQSHNIVRHPDMPCVAYSQLWENILARRDWRGMVKNRCKNGDHYWVDVTLSPQIGNDGSVIGYYAVRRKPTKAQIDEATALYAQMRESEGTLSERSNMSRAQIDRLYKASPIYQQRT